MRANSKAIQLSPQNKFNTPVPVLITGEGDLIRHHHPQQRAAPSNAGHLGSRSESLLDCWQNGERQTDQRPDSHHAVPRRAPRDRLQQGRKLEKIQQLSATLIFKTSIFSHILSELIGEKKKRTSWSQRSTFKECRFSSSNLASAFNSSTAQKGEVLHAKIPRLAHYRPTI